MPLAFDLFALRFCFAASEPIHFPSGETANLFRGQFGKAMNRRWPEAYAQYFAPAANRGEGPSGLLYPPRPFVFRIRHLEGATFSPGESFHAGINLFETGTPPIDVFEETLREMMRGRAALQCVEGRDLMRLKPAPQPAQRIRVRFLTPTELKGADRPEFGPLVARIRDRISTLRALYGAGPLEINFKTMGERAARVAMTRCEIQHVETKRRSGRTG